VLTRVECVDLSYGEVVLARHREES
jgi:hypothetical protein